MLLTVAEFRHRVATDLEGLIADLREETGRGGAQESDAWRRSLPVVSIALGAPSVQAAHLFFGKRGGLALEYRLPAASAWCDVVLLGNRGLKPRALILELKHWSTAGDRPGAVEGLIVRQGRQDLHPSDQVRGYVEYCERFHSTIADVGADVAGAVLFTTSGSLTAYREAPNADLTSRYPIFSQTDTGAEGSFVKFLSEQITAPDPAFASAFTTGQYRQERGFVAQVGHQLLNSGTPAFTLLDNQRRALNLCQSLAQDVLVGANTPDRAVMIVQGPPGSGKSAVAATLWAQLASNPALPDGDIVITTTSQSQNSNWEYLVQQAATVGAAWGVVRKASIYSPITTEQLGRLRRKHGLALLPPSAPWQENLRELARLNVKPREGARDLQNLVTIVDEAHALVNSEHSEGRGQHGFAAAAGPQAYHIMRSSRLTVFFLEEAQGFRLQENTTVADIERWAVDELGVKRLLRVDLSGAQFRCAGSTEYLEWVEGLLGGRSAPQLAPLAGAWRRDGLDVSVYAEPETWERDLRVAIASGRTARLLAPYARSWVTKGHGDPHSLRPADQDFHEVYRIRGKERTWSRPWNHVPGGDYARFGSGSAGGRIHDDPLAEVGCPYLVRGLDFDHVGLFWPNDLLWRGDRWVVDAEACEETGFSRVIRGARKESAKKMSGPMTAELTRRVLMAYRILLTRHLRALHLWIPDAETREHVLRSATS